MRLVKQHIQACQRLIEQHPFFRTLHGGMPAAELLVFAPKLTFWVMTFQDILRLNEGMVRDPKLKRVARHHRAEDAGHEKWFLADLVQVGDVPSVSEVFGADHQPVRDASFALVAETFHAASDRQRVVLLLALESVGHCFFTHVSKAVAASGQGEKLRYFSDFHLKVEKAHQVFEDAMEEELFREVLVDSERAAIMDLVDRVYASFSTIFDCLVLPGAEALPERRSARGQ